jgi:hypothetical protein
MQAKRWRAAVLARKSAKKARASYLIAKLIIWKLARYSAALFLPRRAPNSAL